MMREFDEAHLHRLLYAKWIECGENYAAVDRALGLPTKTTGQILTGLMAMTPKAAAALGYRRTIGGKLTWCHRPVKFVVLDEESISQKETK